MDVLFSQDNFFLLLFINVIVYVKAALLLFSRLAHQFQTDSLSQSLACVDEGKARAPHLLSQTALSRTPHHERHRLRNTHVGCHRLSFGGLLCCLFLRAAWKKARFRAIMYVIDYLGNFGNFSRRCKN